MEESYRGSLLGPFPASCLNLRTQSMYFHVKIVIAVCKNASCLLQKSCSELWTSSELGYSLKALYKGYIQESGARNEHSVQAHLEENMPWPGRKPTSESYLGLALSSPRSRFVVKLSLRQMCTPFCGREESWWNQKSLSLPWASVGMGSPLTSSAMVLHNYGLHANI